jgi:ABC-type phosphonate transport system ATPase subunit
LRDQATLAEAEQRQVPRVDSGVGAQVRQRGLRVANGAPLWGM